MARPSASRSRSVKAVSSWSGPIRRPVRKSTGAAVDGRLGQREPTLVGVDTRPGRTAQRQGVDHPGSDPQIGVGAGAEGAGVVAPVDGLEGDDETGAVQAVVDPELQGKGIAGLGMKPVGEDGPVRVLDSASTQLAKRTRPWMALCLAGSDRATCW